MTKRQEGVVQDSVAYHHKLASGWDQRYLKPSWRARLRVLEECLAGTDLRNQDWLDAGCGSGTLARYLAEGGCRVLGVDAAEGMVDMAHQLASQDMRRDQLTFQKITTIAALPVADLSVDGILCSSVLEYVDNPGACLAEFARVLRSGGVLIITVPNRYSLVRRAQVITHRLGPLVQRECFAFLDYSKNEYSPSEFRTVLRSHGFATDKVIPFGSPIPHWLQRQEFGGSLLAFRAIRE